MVEKMEEIKNQFWTYISSIKAENEKLISIHAKQKEKIRLLEQLLAQKEEQERAAVVAAATDSKKPKKRRRIPKQQVEEKFKPGIHANQRKENHVRQDDNDDA
jgi:hypothetical protein